MDSLRTVVVASFVAGMASSALAADILVPQDVRNLRDALFMTQPGDRVIVTGGTWRNGRMMAPGVRLIGRGATLSGLWEVYGTGASIEGCTVRDGVIQIEADGVTLRRNRFVPPGAKSKVTGEGVSGLVLEDNRFVRSRAEVRDTTGCLLRGNRYLGGGCYVWGDGTLVEENVLLGNSKIAAGFGTNVAVRGNSGGFLDLRSATDAFVERNSAQRIEVTGNGALVAHNDIPAGRSLYVEGDDVVVLDNRVSSVFRSGGFAVHGDRLTVTDNVIDNLGTSRARLGTWAVMTIGGRTSGRSLGPSKVLRNQVIHRLRGGMEFSCNDAEIGSNTMRGTGAYNSLWIQGQRNNVHDNTIVRQAEVDNLRVGIRLEGDENVVADTSVDQAPYDGVVVSGTGNLLARVHVGKAGRCGITVDESAATTGIADCTVDGARWASLYVLGTDTTVTGGSFTGGRQVDVLDLGTGSQFVTVTFDSKSENLALKPYR